MDIRYLGNSRVVFGIFQNKRLFLVPLYDRRLTSGQAPLIGRIFQAVSLAEIRGYGFPESLQAAGFAAKFPTPASRNRPCSITRGRFRK